MIRDIIKCPPKMPVIDFQRVETLADCHTEGRLIADAKYIDALLAAIKRYGSRCVVLCDIPAIKPALVYTLTTRLSVPVVAFGGRADDSISFFESSIHVVDSRRFVEFSKHIKPNAVILLTPYFITAVAELDDTIPVTCLVPPYFEVFEADTATRYNIAGVDRITGIEPENKESTEPTRPRINPCGSIMISVIVCVSGFISGMVLCHHLTT